MGTMRASDISVKGDEGVADIRLGFSDETWAEIRKILESGGEKRRRGRPRACDRRCLEAVVWKLLNAKPWSQLPPSLGSASTAHRHFQRWQERGALEKLRRWMIRRLRRPGACRMETPGCLLMAKALGALRVVRGKTGALKHRNIGMRSGPIGSCSPSRARGRVKKA